MYGESGSCYHSYTLTLLNSERPKLHIILAFLSAKGLTEWNTRECSFMESGELTYNVLKTSDLDIWLCYEVKIAGQHILPLAAYATLQFCTVNNLSIGTDMSVKTVQT